MVVLNALDDVFAHVDQTLEFGGGVLETCHTAKLIYGFTIGGVALKVTFITKLIFIAVISIRRQTTKLSYSLLFERVPMCLKLVII